MLLANGINVAFTDRHGGFSVEPYAGRNLGGNVGDDPATVLRNRDLTAQELGVPRHAYMRQIHSACVAYVKPGDDPGELDAIFTDHPAFALVALGADCPAVLIANPEAGIVGAAHSGRVGTELEVVPALVKAMQDHGPGDLTAIIGPSACGRCYEVSPELHDAAPPPMRSMTSWGTPALDLRAGITTQLTTLGVTVHHDSRCTIEDPALYSYRRDGITGRFGGYIWISP